MSYHILHITTAGCYISCDKGFLFCDFKDGNKNKIPVDDIKIIVVATHGVAFSNACISRLLENDIVVLHCKYKSIPLVYDLVEPYRAFADYYFYKFSQDKEDDFECENFKE